MRFVIQGELPSLNEYTKANRGNRYIGNKMKRDATEYVKWFASQMEPIHTPIRLLCTYYCKNKRKDPDNIVFAKKFILDALIEACVIENDGWGEIKGFEDFWVVDKNNPRIEVELISVKV